MSNRFSLLFGLLTSILCLLSCEDDVQVEGKINIDFGRCMNALHLDLEDSQCAPDLPKSPEACLVIEQTQGTQKRLFIPLKWMEDGFKLKRVINSNTLDDSFTTRDFSLNPNNTGFFRLFLVKEQSLCNETTLFTTTISCEEFNQEMTQNICRISWAHSQ